MQCKELEAVLESEGLSPLPAEARAHLAGCSTCQDLLADLSAIVVAAKRVPAEATPPDRIWISLRAQLEAEGLIHDVQAVPIPSPSWWDNFASLFRPRSLATAGALLAVVLGSIYFVEHRSPLQTAETPRQVPVQASKESGLANPVGDPGTKPVLSATDSSPRDHQAPPPDLPAHARPSTKELTASPTENAYLGQSAAVLNETEGALPTSGYTGNATADASFRQNLRTLNEFIAECESRLKQNPQDELTREYLSSAYQQKAELLTAMMDSGRSEH